MKQYAVIVGATCLVMTLLAGSAFSNNRTDDPLGIAVAPHTLVLSKSQGAVSVHTYIPYSRVECDTLILESDVPGADSLDPTWTKADDRGNLVAYFDEDEVKSIVAVPETTLTLTGVLAPDDEIFRGSDEVNVKP